MKGYHIKVSLEGCSPAIYRKIRIPEGLTFEELHLIIQCAMGWENYHLYEFFNDQGELDELAKVDAFLSEGTSLRYIYDFGDNWKHRIECIKELSKVLKKDQIPEVLAASGSCPPEDCGGIWRFNELRACLKRKEGPEYREAIEWLGCKEIPPYNKEEANEELRMLFQQNEK